MPIEIPVCKRCCFCLPLRYGLIVWGYLRLFISIMLVTLMSIVAFAYNKIHARDRVFCGVATVIAISDFVLSLVYITGCHKKNVKLMKIYYFYSQLLLGLTTAFSIFMLGWIVVAFFRYALYSKYYSENGLLEFGRFLLTEGVLYFAHTFLQLYMLLLVRSEILKLNNGCEFRFVNNAVEAQCTLDVKTLPIQRVHNDNATE